MTATQKGNRRLLLVGVAMGLVIWAALQIAQRSGALQSWELRIYDRLIRLRHTALARRGDPASRPDERIVIVGYDEQDLETYGHPMSDERLAELLEKIRAAAPCAIGVDIYRNLAEPRQPGNQPNPRLTSVFATTPNLIAIFTTPDLEGRYIRPPPFFETLNPEERTYRLAFNTFPTDRDRLRRALVDDLGADREHYFSLAMNLALLRLEREGLAMAPVDNDPDRFQLGKALFTRFHSSDGGYANAEESGFQFLLDFKGPETFSTLPARDVFEGRVAASAFQDKIVLVATTAESVKDSNSTPLNADTRGIVLHAQIINQLLRAALQGDRLLRFWSNGQEIAWSLLWALTGALGGAALSRKPLLASAILAPGAAALLFLPGWAFGHDLWIPAVAPALGFVLAAVGALGLVYGWERRERSQLMQLFSRHVSGKVARSIWEERDQFLDGNRPRSLKLNATVLFTDFVGFSSVSETMHPEALMEWLNAGMERLAGQVEAHEGIVNKYIGDAIMAVFGVPVPRQTPAQIAADAVNAVRCALAMSKELDALNEEWTREGRPRIGMRIGIFSGPLVAGSMGSAERLEFTVIGDTVNTASRLESTKKDEIPAPPGRSCRILVGESTWRLLDGRFSSDFEAEEELKGKENKVKTYRIVAEHFSPEPSSQTVLLPTAP